MNDDEPDVGADFKWRILQEWDVGGVYQVRIVTSEEKVRIPAPIWVVLSLDHDGDRVMMNVECLECAVTLADKILEALGEATGDIPAEKGADEVSP